MKLLVDMNLSPQWCEYLRAGGWAAVHWMDIGDFAASDARIMAWARQHEHVVLTHDLDFGALLAAGAMKGPNVIQIRSQDVSPQALGPTLLKLLREHEYALAHGALITVDPPCNRIRILPITRRP